MLELVTGSQLAVFDRASARVHILDDSGRPLWSFAAGGGRKAAEPTDIAVSADGARLYLLWPEGQGITVADIFGRTASELSFSLENFLPARIAAAATADGAEWLCLTDRRSRLILLEIATQELREPAGGLTRIWDIRSAGGRPGVIYLLAGRPPALAVINLEKEK